MLININNLGDNMIDLNLSIPPQVQQVHNQTTSSRTQVRLEGRSVTNHPDTNNSSSSKRKIDQLLQKQPLSNENLPLKKRRIQPHLLSTYNIATTPQPTHLYNSSSERIALERSAPVRIDRVNHFSSKFSIVSDSTDILSSLINRSHQTTRPIYPNQTQSSIFTPPNPIECSSSPYSPSSPYYTLLNPTRVYVDINAQTPTSTVDHIPNNPIISNLPRHLRFLEQQNPQASFRFIIVQKLAHDLLEIDRQEYKTKFKPKISLQMYQWRQYKVFIEFPNDKIKNIKLDLVKTQLNTTEESNQANKIYNLLDAQTNNTFSFNVNPELKISHRNEPRKNVEFKLKLEIETTDERKIEEYSHPFSLRKQINTGTSKKNTFVGRNIPIKVKSYEDLNAFI